jgi:fluoride exporter
MLRNLLLAGTGGFTGSMLRYFIQIVFEKNLSGTFPYGTMTANILGSFIIGVVFALSKKGGLITCQDLKVLRYEKGEKYKKLNGS